MFHKILKGKGTLFTKIIFIEMRQRDKVRDFIYTHLFISYYIYYIIILCHIITYNIILDYILSYFIYKIHTYQRNTRNVRGKILPS